MSVDVINTVVSFGFALVCVVVGDIAIAHTRRS